MDTIVISVGPHRKEDDLLDLVNILSKQFVDNIVRCSDALLIETDVPQAAAIFRAIAGTVISPVNDNKPICIDCGAEVTKAGNRCRPCGQKAIVRNKAALAAKKAAEQPGPVHPQETGE